MNQFDMLVMIPIKNNLLSHPKDATSQTQPPLPALPPPQLTGPSPQYAIQQHVQTPQPMDIDMKVIYTCTLFKQIFKQLPLCHVIIKICMMHFHKL